MPKNLRENGLRLLFAIALATGLPCVAAAHEAMLQNAPPKDAASDQALADFAHRVDAYQKLRHDLESKLPALKSTDNPQTILAHENALAQSIVEARKDAKRGDIFTEPISAAFRKILHAAFTGPHGRSLYRTMYQGEPLNLTLQINQIYPPTLPVTTVPPTLLQALPKLPARLEYRIVGRNLILEDVKSRLIVDYMEDAYPKPTP